MAGTHLVPALGRIQPALMRDNGRGFNTCDQTDQLQSLGLRLITGTGYVSITAAPNRQTERERESRSVHDGISCQTQW